jgi:hypothetical protein
MTMLFAGKIPNGVYNEILKPFSPNLSGTVQRLCVGGHEVSIVGHVTFASPDRPIMGYTTGAMQTLSVRGEKIMSAFINGDQVRGVEIEESLVPRAFRPFFQSENNPQLALIA